MVVRPRVEEHVVNLDKLWILWALLLRLDVFRYILAAAVVVVEVLLRAALVFRLYWSFIDRIVVSLY